MSPHSFSPVPVSPSLFLLTPFYPTNHHPAPASTMRLIGWLLLLFVCGSCTAKLVDEAFKNPLCEWTEVRTNATNSTKPCKLYARGDKCPQEIKDKEGMDIVCTLTIQPTDVTSPNVTSPTPPPKDGASNKLVIGLVVGLVLLLVVAGFSGFLYWGYRKQKNKKKDVEPGALIQEEVKLAEAAPEPAPEKATSPEAPQPVMQHQPEPDKADDENTQNSVSARGALLAGSVPPSTEDTTQRLNEDETGDKATVGTQQETLVHADESRLDHDAQRANVPVAGTDRLEPTQHAQPGEAQPSPTADDNKTASKSQSTGSGSGSKESKSNSERE